MSAQKTQAENLTDRLIGAINPLIESLGYEVVYLEILTHRQKTLRLFIDFRVSTADKTIGIEDCVRVTKALDEPLDQVPLIEEIFHGAYELEVSSPGVDRPLRQAKDFSRFTGREVRIHTFRPLKPEEIGNPSYYEKNPRQKNFYGTLSGFDQDRVRLAISAGPAASRGKSGKKSKTTKENGAKSLPEQSGAEISIPLPLISKANLEPKFDFDSSLEEAGR